MNEKLESRVSKKEQCVLCGKETQYSKNIPIQRRYEYVDGVGQLCVKCSIDYGLKTTGECQ
jgi:hypothetical protein